MALPYPTKVVLPFDIATAQDMNERHANDVALAAGTGLDDGAITADKLDFTTLAFGNYSTMEVDTGFKWTDGKAVYKRTFSGTITIGSNTRSATTLIATGVSTLVSSSGAVADNAGEFVQIGHEWFSSAGAVYLKSYINQSAAGAVTLYTFATSARTGAPYTATAYYTKT